MPRGPSPVSRSVQVARLSALCVALVVVACIVGGCDNQRLDGIFVRNETSATLHFAMIGADQSRFDVTYIPGLKPGHTAELLGGGQLTAPSHYFDAGKQCSLGSILAFDTSNRLVARRDAPLCVNQTWVIRP